MLKPLVPLAIVALAFGGFWWIGGPDAPEDPTESLQPPESEGHQGSEPNQGLSSNRIALQAGPGSTERCSAQILKLDRLLRDHAKSHDGVFPARLEDLDADLADTSFDDPWQRALYYQAPSHRVPYQLYSLGADGQPGGAGEDRDLFLGDLKQN